MQIAKIVSGGQTGVDRGALEAALELGFPYGGMIPKERLAEDGIVPEKFDRMEESTRKDYLYRTEWNVVHSDATLVLAFGTKLTGGTKRTVEFCKKHGKPYWVEDLNAPKETDRGPEVLYWLEALGGSIILNVAGPRESKSSGIQQTTREYVKELIGVCGNTHGDVGKKGLAICSEQMYAGAVGARCRTLRANFRDCDLG